MVDTKEEFTLKSAGTLTTGAGKDRWEAPFDGQIIHARGVVGTAPTGATLITDILKNGTTIYSSLTNRPIFAIGATETADPVETISDDASTDSWDVQEGTAYTQPSPAKGRITWSDTPDVTAFSAGDTLTLSITQVGSTVAGADLEITVEYIPK